MLTGRGHRSVPSKEPRADSDTASVRTLSHSTHRISTQGSELGDGGLKQQPCRRRVAPGCPEQRVRRGPRRGGVELDLPELIDPEDGLQKITAAQSEVVRAVVSGDSPCCMARL